MLNIFLSFFFCLVFYSNNASALPANFTQANPNLEIKLTEAVQIITENEKTIHRLESSLAGLENKLANVETALLARERNQAWSVNQTFASCGGAVSLIQYGKLNYQNEGDKDEICMWILTSSFTGMILTLQNFSNLETEPHNQLSVHYNLPEYSIASFSRVIGQKDKGEEIEINENIVVLTFISKKGQGFELQMKQSGDSRVENPRHVTMTSLDAANGTKYSYPRGPYLNNQAHHVLIKPDLGQRVRVSLTALKFRERDHLSIFKISKIDNQFSLLQKCGGDLGEEFLSDNYEGDVDDSILIYFESDPDFLETEADDPAARATGFTISYTSLDPTSTRPYRTNCGGSIVLFKLTSLTFNSFDQEQDNKTCIWVIKTFTKGSIGLTLLQGNLTNSLGIHFHFERRPEPVSDFIKPKDFEKELIINTTHMILSFTSRPGQSFDLRLRHLVDNEEEPEQFQLKVKALYLDPSDSNSTTFNYPMKLSLYESNERSYVILGESKNPQKSLKFIAQSLYLEAPFDYFKLFKFSKTLNQFVFVQRFSSNDGDLNTTDVCGGHFEQYQVPLLLYFHSDSSTHRRGLSFSYLEEDQSNKLACSEPVATNVTGLFSNPIETQNLPPSIYFDPSSKLYYWVIGEGHQIYVRTSPSLTNWVHAPEKTVFVAPGIEDQIDLPKIQKIGESFYIYFQLGRKSDIFSGRMFVIKANGKSPDSNYGDSVRLVPEGDTDVFAKESTVLETGGQLQLIWSAREALNKQRPYVLFIAPLKTPTEIGGPTILLRRPTTKWESRIDDQDESGVAECPQIVYKEGNVYLFFTGGEWSSNENCVGMMTLEGGKNPLVPQNWKSTNECVFHKDVEQGVYSVGRFTLTTSRDLEESWIVYQARNASVKVKTVRAQKYDWNLEVSAPIFTAQGLDVEMRVPSGQMTNTV